MLLSSAVAREDVLVVKDGLIVLQSAAPVVDNIRYSIIYHYRIFL